MLFFSGDKSVAPCFSCTTMQGFLQQAGQLFFGFDVIQNADISFQR